MYPRPTGILSLPGTMRPPSEGKETSNVRKAEPSRSFMVHIALYEGTADGDGAAWLEHVTDEQYKAAAAAAEAS